MTNEHDFETHHLTHLDSCPGHPLLAFIEATTKPVSALL
jgi:hypothetical protein